MLQLPKTAPVNPKKLLHASSFLYSALFLVVVTLLIIAVLFKSQYFKIREFSNVNFYSAAAKTNYTKYLSSGLRKSSFEDLQKAFLILVSDYNSQASSAKRLVLTKLENHLKTNYGFDYSKSGLVVPCREESCGFKASYSASVQTIKQGIESNKMIGPDLKKSLLIGVENAAVNAASGNPKLEFGDLTTVFSQLKNLYAQEKDDSIKKLSSQVLNEMGKVEPELFKTGSERGYYNLE